MMITTEASYCVDVSIFGEGMSSSQFTHPIEVVSCRIAWCKAGFFYSTRQNDRQSSMDIGTFVDGDLADLYT